MQENCIFCQIIRGEIPSFNVWEDEDTFAFMDINPVHDGHVLIIPKEHADDVFTVSAAASGAVMRTAQRVARSVRAVHPAPDRPGHGTDAVAARARPTSRRCRGSS